MAIYFAIVRDDHIQRDTRTDQLEIYDTELAARRHMRSGDKMVRVDVTRCACSCGEVAETADSKDEPSCYPCAYSEAN